MNKKEIISIVCVLSAICFVTGYSFVKREHGQTQYVTEGKHINMDVNNTVLGEILTFSKDTSYLIFVFSYSCPHCYNSIENLKQYERLDVVDKIIGISYATNNIVTEKFNDIFNPNFLIKTTKPEHLFRLTNQFPISYYVKNNIIKMEIQGVLPCGYILREQLNK